MSAPGPARSGSIPGNSGSNWDALMLVAAGLLLIAQGRIHSFIPGASALRPALLLGFVGLVLWLVNRHPARSPLRLPENPVSKAAIFVMAWAIIGIPFSVSLGGSARFFLDTFTRTFAVFLIIFAAVRNLEDVRRLLGAWALGTGVFATMASVGRNVGGGAGGYDPNDSAMFMVSGLPALVFFILHGRHVAVRVLAAVAALNTIAGVVTTHSRGGFLALVIVLAFMLVMMKAVKPAVRIGIVVFVVAAAIPVASTDYWDRMRTISELDDGYGGDDGISGRRNTWERGLQYTWANPVTGIGINMFPRMEGRARAHRIRQPGTWRSAHSTWIQALAELGIPGFVAFLGMFVLALKVLWRLQGATWQPPPPSSAEEVRALSGLLMASLLGAMVAASFLTHAYSGLLWGPLAVIAGLAKVLAVTEGKGGARPAVRPGASGRS